MSEFTYGAMDKVLRSLGFTCHVLRREPAARWYEHPETGAVISLPLYPADKPVLSNDLAAVRGTLEVYEIADPLKLGAELQKAS